MLGYRQLNKQSHYTLAFHYLKAGNNGHPVPSYFPVLYSFSADCRVPGYLASNIFYLQRMLLYLDADSSPLIDVLRRSYPSSR